MKQSQPNKLGFKTVPWKMNTEYSFSNLFGYDGKLKPQIILNEVLRLINPIISYLNSKTHLKIIARLTIKTMKNIIRYNLHLPGCKYYNQFTGVKYSHSQFSYYCVGACYFHAATVDYHATLVSCSHKSFMAYVVNNLQAHFTIIAKQAYLLDIIIWDHAICMQPQQLILLQL